MWGSSLETPSEYASAKSGGEVHRDVIITNLPDSFDLLMAFGEKHLKDTFRLEGIRSVSARDDILREMISNLLAHRDFSIGYVAETVIEKDQMDTENANLSHGHGVLNLLTFGAFAQNPPISKVFREIGLDDELGSGMRNTYKYTKMYSNREPQFIEGDIFKIVIPLSDVATATAGPSNRIVNKHTEPSDVAGDGVGDEVGDGVGGQVSVSGQASVPVPVKISLNADRLNLLLDFCAAARTRSEMMNVCGVQSRYQFRIHILNPMLQAGLLKRTIPDKPNSSRQKYIRAGTGSMLTAPNGYIAHCLWLAGDFLTPGEKAVRQYHIAAIPGSLRP